MLYTKRRARKLKKDEILTILENKRADKELIFFRRMIKDLCPTGIVSIVSDTYDYFQVLTKFTKELREDILVRQPNAQGIPAKVVFRPDSGDPTKIICGDPDSEDELERKGSLQLLWDEFGGTVNDQGFKVLNPAVGLIYGDGCNLVRITNIFETMEELGWATSNIVFGVGSYTYQYVTRDNYGFAMKATWCRVNGEDHNIFKLPKTDKNFSKKSMKGLLCVNEDFTVEQEVNWGREREGILEDVFVNGKLTRDQTLQEIREIVRQPRLSLVIRN